jgi:hypothetical protein
MGTKPNWKRVAVLLNIPEWLGSDHSWETLVTDRINALRSSEADVERLKALSTGQAACLDAVANALGGPSCLSESLAGRVKELRAELANRTTERNTSRAMNAGLREALATSERMRTDLNHANETLRAELADAKASTGYAAVHGPDGPWVRLNTANATNVRLAQELAEARRVVDAQASRIGALAVRSANLEALAESVRHYSVKCWRQHGYLCLASALEALDAPAKPTEKPDIAKLDAEIAKNVRDWFKDMRQANWDRIMTAVAARDAAEKSKP